MGETIGFADVSVQAFHEAPACPAVSLADVVREYTDTILLYPGDSEVDGWREVLTRLPCLDLRSIEEPLRKFHSVITQSRIVYSSGEEDVSYLYAKVLDTPLNYIMENKIDAFVKMIDYSATPDYEEFRLWVFPPAALSTLADGLKEYAQEFTFFGKKLRPLTEMHLPTALRQPTFEKVLDEEEESLLRTAFERGWFDYPRPRKARIRELSKEFGLAPSTVDVHLRSISRRLSQAYFRRRLFRR